MNNGRQYTVKKADLLDKLRANRERHQKLHELAIHKWRLYAVEELSKALKLAEAGEPFKFPQLAKPLSFAREYDSAIGLLEMTLSDEAQITTAEFENYVRDNWGFSHTFRTSNANYVGAATMSAMGFDLPGEDE